MYYSFCVYYFYFDHFLLICKSLLINIHFAYLFLSVQFLLYYKIIVMNKLLAP